MKNFINRFKIPTILGIGIILIGIGVGVFLVLKEQIFLSSAAPSISAQNITVSNIEDSTAVISWQTTSSAPAFVTFGQNDPSDLTVLDDRDTKQPQSHLMHYVTIKNLLPKTSYQYKIISGKISSEINKFTTAAPLSSQTGFRPVIGTVLDNNNPLNEGIAFLSTSGAIIQSSLIKSGNFLIPLSKILKTDLSNIYPLTAATEAKLTIISAKGETSVVFSLKMDGVTLPSLKIGEIKDLTIPEPTPISTPNTFQDLKIYDLNGDGKINAADNAIILQNFGKKGQGVKGDLNRDGIVDQKDLDLMAKQINQ